MTRPDPSTFKVHLLGLQPGERFKLSLDAGAEVYEVAERPASKGGEGPTLVVRKPDGKLSPTARIFALNDSSYFVHQVPNLNPTPDPKGGSS